MEEAVAAEKPQRPVKLAAPLWSEDKAELIAEYIHRFLFVTKHGVYLDLFAGPQHADRPETWSVKRVLQRRTSGPAINRYVVCDISRRKVARLHDLATEHADVPISVHAGDANAEVRSMLRSALIRPSTACFCLIDQHTNQCHWSTVRAVAGHKESGYKIEIFYFLAERWLMRSWASTTRVGKIAAWWGRADYGSFLSMSSVRRAHYLSARFRDELGYAFATPYSIHEHGPQSATMYYMIHATDHPRAPRLMSEAYRGVWAKRTSGSVQTTLFA